MPTQSEIEGSLELAKKYQDLMSPNLPEIVAIHLAATCRAEKARADLIERQYAELVQWYFNAESMPEVEAEKHDTLLTRHESERKAAQ